MTGDRASFQLIARRRWVERGLGLEAGKPGFDRSGNLKDLRRKILSKLGSGEEALASAWDDYRRSPSVFSYEELLRYVPKTSARSCTKRRSIRLAGRIFENGSRFSLLLGSPGNWRNLSSV